ncbi:MAG: DinB family protein [Acidobacteria bacterium]|nr:MAG: DinB family protein [Acidobacteriota bacterium]
MRKLISAILFGLIVAVPMVAQNQQQAPPSFTAFLKNMYTGNRSEISRSAAKFPEEFYGMRPGPQKEVRTFGQLVGHLADFNYLWCSQAKGEKNPSEGKDLEKLTSKADLAKALSDAFAYCDSVYSSLTDASGQEILEITQEDGRKRRINRLSLLVLNYGHNEHHYGNIITYMRMKSIVPASSEPR